jgi:hypothetical protein
LVDIILTPTRVSSKSLVVVFRCHHSVDNFIFILKEELLF